MMRTFTYSPEHIGTLPDENGNNAKRPKLNVLGREFSWPPVNRHMLDKRHYVVLPDVINEPYEVKQANTVDFAGRNLAPVPQRRVPRDKGDDAS